jgi:hypothetical protein
MTDHSITLTAQELAAPFKISDADAEPLTGPTRIPCIAEGNPPKYVYLKYVMHHEVEAYVARGWVVSDDLSGTHHGFHACVMSWPYEGEPE